MKKFRVLFTILAILTMLLFVCATIVGMVLLFDFLLSVKEVKVLTADFGISAILGIIATAIATATAVGTGAASAAKANEAELKADIDKAKNDSWFNKEYYQDALSKKENKKMIDELNAKFNNSQQEQNATSSILGIPTDISKQSNLQNNESYASAIGDIKSSNEKYKESLLENYKNKDIKYNENKMNAQSAKANAVTGIVTNTASSIGEVAGSFGGGSQNNTNNEV